MEQILVDLYALANIGLLMYYIRKYGLTLSPGLLVLAFYVIIAIFAVPAYEILQHDNFFSQYNFKNITIFPYIFLFITTLFFLIPTFHLKKYIDNVNISISEKKTKYFIIIYSICALISTYCFYRSIISNVSIEALNQMRQDHYEGESVKAYNNIIEHICIYLTVNLNIIASIIFFYTLAYRSKDIGKWWLIGLGIGIIAPPFMDAIRTASRGMIITQSFQLLICYSFFQKRYSNQIKKFFISAGGILAVLFIIYSLLVTTMRFGLGKSDDAALSSLISYFGQPTIVFNSQTADINHFANGRVFFHPFAEILNLNPDGVMAAITKKWSPCFYTLIGYLYIDFGPIGTFILSVFIPYLVNSFFKNQGKISIAQLYLITFYCLTLQHGALVIGRGFISNLIYCFFIYQITKIIFKPRTRVRQNKLTLPSPSYSLKRNKASSYINNLRTID